MTRLIHLDIKISFSYYHINDNASENQTEEPFKKNQIVSDKCLKILKKINIRDQENRPKNISPWYIAMCLRILSIFSNKKLIHTSAILP